MGTSFDGAINCTGHIPEAKIARPQHEPLGADFDSMFGNLSNLGIFEFCQNDGPDSMPRNGGWNTRIDKRAF